MVITDLPLFSMLRTRMHWHQERQRVLAENVSNANTPEFRPRDLAAAIRSPPGCGHGDPGAHRGCPHRLGLHHREEP